MSNLEKYRLQDTGPFKNSNGNMLLKSLFHETKAHGLKGIYTLKDKDHEFEGHVYPSLYKLYMATEDLTEYEFACKYLDSWEQWVKLCETTWFKEYINRWRTELELKLKAQALRRLMEEARDGGKNSYNANKFIVERGWVPKETEVSRRGRPSKQEISRRAAEEVFSDRQIEEDIKRLELN